MVDTVSCDELRRHISYVAEKYVGLSDRVVIQKTGVFYGCKVFPLSTRCCLRILLQSVQ